MVTVTMPRFQHDISTQSRCFNPSEPPSLSFQYHMLLSGAGPGDELGHEDASEYPPQLERGLDSLEPQQDR